MNKTVEDQYNLHLQLKKEKGITQLGLEKSGTWLLDPKHLCFALSRYKFVAKMLSGKKSVLEIGCGDAFATPMLLQEVESLHAIDIDSIFIEDAIKRMDTKWLFTCEVHDILSGPVKGVYDAAYSLDVLEHIPQDQENLYFKHIIHSLIKTGILIIGMPSLESQIYASPMSQIGHVNCKTGPDLKQLMLNYFENVFIFSMNDEVVHTGYHAMAHYLFAMGVGVK